MTLSKWVWMMLAGLATALPMSLAMAADVNLKGYPIKLKSTFAGFEDVLDGSKRTAPVETQLFVTDDTGTEMKVRVRGDLPENTIPDSERIDRSKTYKVTASEFSPYWILDLDGASRPSASSSATLAGSVLLMRADYPDARLDKEGKAYKIPKDSKVRVRSDDGKELGLVLTQPRREGLKDRLTCDSDKVLDANSSCAPIPDTEVKPGPLYKVDKSEFTSGYWSRSGWSYGALFVPFKMRFKDKSITGESMLGGYLGYEFQPYGISVTPALHAGLSVVSVGGDGTAGQNINDTTTKPAFTWGVALILKPGENFQAGVVLGRDQIGGTDGAKWQYEGGWWLSVAIGYNFAR